MVIEKKKGFITLFTFSSKLSDYIVLWKRTTSGSNILQKVLPIESKREGGKEGGKTEDIYSIYKTEK